MSFEQYNVRQSGAFNAKFERSLTLVRLPALAQKLKTSQRHLAEGVEHLFGILFPLKEISKYKLFPLKKYLNTKKKRFIQLLCYSIYIGKYSLIFKQ